VRTFGNSVVRLHPMPLRRRREQPVRRELLHANRLERRERPATSISTPPAAC
jgi:hypothetical protein